MNCNQVGIIGGGPAGIFAALSVRDFYNVDVTVIDKKRHLSTLLPTGGGRCNLSYYDTDKFSFAKNYPRGEKFLLSALSSFGMSETVDYFESIGIKTYVQEDNRIFPVCNSSEIMSEILLKRAELLGIRLKRGNVSSVKKTEKGFCVQTDDGTECFEKLIISTGGKSFELLKSLGHNIIPPKPSLCPLKIKENYFYSLSGLSLRNISAITEFQNRKIAQVKGDLLFAEDSVSGPLAFTVSSVCAFIDFNEENPVKLKLNVSNLSENQLTEFFGEIKTKTPKISVKNALSVLCPKNLIRIILEICEIDEMKQVANINKKEVNKLIQNLCSLEMNVCGRKDKLAMVTAGGVDLKEVNSKTMESKIVSDLYFVGEVLNTDGFTGGFNLQNCWSTARAAARNLYL